ncbi:MAG: indolepyruvate ferredoxin oxidoreductase subunit alpha [Spirochaetales bacterium]|nr:indolepyruvate ferredoxin oxidoreductase subunit alpha [Spirochaetales bacterium]
MKKLLSGNEGIALGAYEAGVKVVTGYPGTPSTEITETLSEYKDVYSEWSVNEKVALEVASGASLGGKRTLVTMKHVGVNVAADPLFTMSYIGVKGGLVIVSADDPQSHSSQNEQDNRHYARAAKLPMFEPSDSEDARQLTRLAFDVSEKFDTPVFLRPTTRICHSYSVVDVGGNERAESDAGKFERNLQKYVMIPAYARARHFDVEKRMEKLKEFAETTTANTTEFNNTEIGFITSGVSYNYVKEAAPEASVLKLGMVYPLPEHKIKDFCSKVKKVYVVEELDPFFEDQIKAMGCEVEGKKKFPITGELSPDNVEELLFGKKELLPPEKIPSRLPALCPGCPHSFVYNVLKKHNILVSGDIGCYTLGVMPPFQVIDTCIDMGASITAAQGLEIADSSIRHAAVIGDSTFAHSGITGLINAAYNKRNTLVIVLDNSITAMTGMQHNPFSGETIRGEQTIQVNYRYLAKAVGIEDENFMEVNAYKPDEIEAAIVALADSGKLSLLVVKGICVIYNRKKNKKTGGV